MKKINLFGLFAEDIAELLAPLELPKYRSKQVVEWLYQRDAASFAEMTNLPVTVRALLEQTFSIHQPVLKAQQNSQDGKTSKYLLEFADGEAVETVLMRQPYGNSVCVSSQVGCGMGCVFCASTLQGVIRNLNAGEMLAQVLYIRKILGFSHQTVNNIVIMGSGEPLANYDQVLQFIRLCHQEYCLHLSYRSITLSTSGIVPAMDRLGAEGLPLTLAISLHAPEDTLRSKLMPVNQRYSVREVVAAGDRYAQNTGRRVTYEYALIDGWNDQPVQARQLASLLSGRLCNVNLIPVNAVPERGLARPAPARIESFARILTDRHIAVTVRREMGADIQAACGQLRNKAGKTIH
ncbi:23S rRNA (adenine(2503)-C(2))-methyltransferase RlmN|uniref:Probable dual-specificity RNA methyltransferase RlmN n=1 Tax=Dendrosporobacter quercicolus TaxID=146817 RepID=A0A1G9M412_9FIRM|nr:23S rRNA (adenine(2503)-C(2))-methyltransferase RlmN [Dendrosporobacter quercicolus]NSL46904.1 23S rRNA (adenine(2503)-C(2))-methyltransferase RlmN [Dendrosporobacter quercicolus DSM 1736]SDL68853.1 23S rRNA (adenine2503-C2)-methyltransferase [Dendrosporobacter quercicolus]